MVGALGIIAGIVLRQRDVLMTLGVGVLFLAPTAAMCARRLRWSRTRIACAAVSGASLALVPATTLAREDVLIRWGRPCGVQPGLSLSTPEAMLNALLFVPAAFFGVLALRRFLPVVLAALVCSAVVEAIQSVTALGTCQTADVVRNLTGAVIAGWVAVILLRCIGSLTHTPGEEPGRLEQVGS